MGLVCLTVSLLVLGRHQYHEGYKILLPLSNLGCPRVEAPWMPRLAYTKVSVKYYDLTFLLHFVIIMMILRKYELIN